MSFLTRGNLIKAFAALLIAGFVIELFIVYTYSPSSQQQAGQTNAAASAAPVNEQFVSLSLAPFTIRSFTDAMLFQCNASHLSQLAGFSGLLGPPVAIGVTGNETLFFARANGTIPDAAFLADFKTGLIPFCGSSVVVFREALVSFNGTGSVELVSALNGLNRTNVTKRQLEGYTDRFGRGPLAFVSDANAVSGSLVDLRLVAVLQGGSGGGQIVPDSLKLEQPTVGSSRQKTVELELTGVVDSFTDSRVAVLQVPWENRTVNPAFFNGAVINEELSRRDEIIVANAAGAASVVINESALMVAAPFIVSIENRSGGSLGLNVGNFTDRQAALQALSGLNLSVEFPFSRYLVEFNSTLWQPIEVPFQPVFLKEAVLIPVNSTASGNFTLPAKFTALVFSNVSIGDSVAVAGSAVVEGGKLVQFPAKQIGVDAVL